MICRNMSGISRLLTSKEISEVFNAAALEKIIKHVRHLQSFSCNACEPVSEAVISKLEASWRDTRLCVTNTCRKITVFDELNMDIHFLSTPLLYSLTYSIFYFTVGKGEMLASEMPRLEEVILRSPRLRVLHLRLYRRTTIYSDNSVLVCWTSFVNHSHPCRVDLLTDKAGLNFLNLPFIPGDKLPPIQELQLWTQYNLNY